MKQFYGIGIFLAFVLAVVHFDAIVYFLLTGQLPGLTISLSPSMSIAVLVAATATSIALIWRRRVYHFGLALHDRLLTSDENVDVESAAAVRVPRRRYHHL